MKKIQFDAFYDVTKGYGTVGPQRKEVKHNQMNTKV